MVMEYTLTFFLVITFALGMTVYVRRVVQAKVRGTARYAMNSIGTVFADPSLNFVGNFYGQYEPYYQKSMAIRERESEIVDRMRPVGKDGIIEKEIVHEDARSTTESYQAPPACAD